VTSETVFGLGLSPMTTLVLAAMPEELNATVESVACAVHSVRGREVRVWVHGTETVVFALSGIGKVAAALTTALLCEHFDVTRVIFSGLAGGLGPRVARYDWVIGDSFAQHDFDASPLFAKYNCQAAARLCSRWTQR
jgi:adenosylhomocysteine nucleosidase